MLPGLIRRLMPRAVNFTPLFCEQARLLGLAADELRRVVDGGGMQPGDLARISSLEVEADGVARKVFLAANRTFNAPLDREDILLLAHDLDDVLDLMEDAAKAIDRAGIKDFPAGIKAIVQAVAECTDLLGRTLPLLDDVTTRHDAIFANCEEIGRIEGRADDAFDSGIVELRKFVGDNRIELLAYLDLKEIYELLEDAADGCDDVGNAIRTITTKHV